MRILVISGSLRPHSRCARAGATRPAHVGGTRCRVGVDRSEGNGCAHVLVAAPIYNFDVSAAIKNLVEQTGRAWTDKVVGFLCSAGGRASGRTGSGGCQVGRGYSLVSGVYTGRLNRSFAQS